MNGIVISKALRDSLPPEERDDIEDRLWIKSGGKCFLCSDEMNRASEVLEADHDIPTSMGGENAASPPSNWPLSFLMNGKASFGPMRSQFLLGKPRNRGFCHPSPTQSRKGGRRTPLKPRSSRGFYPTPPSTCRTMCKRLARRRILDR